MKKSFLVKIIIMSVVSQQPIASLSPVPVVTENVVVKPVRYSLGNNWMGLVLWFILAAVVVWLILYSLRPTWVQQRGEGGLPNGNVDAMRVLWASLIIALVIVIIVWLLRSNCA